MAELIEVHVPDNLKFQDTRKMLWLCKPWAILTSEECFKIVNITSQVDQNAHIPVFVGISLCFLDFV